MLLGLVTGADLQLEWGTPFLLFLPAAAMEALGWSQRPPRWQTQRALIVFVLLQLLLLIVNVATSPMGPLRWNASQWEQLDAKAFAEKIAVPARAALGGPMRVIAGPGDIAGALALELPEWPRVLIEGNYQFSPWVSAELVHRCGALVVGPASRMAKGLPVGPGFPDLRWLVVPRAGDADPCE